MLREEILEILDLFDMYKIPEDDQRRLFENGLYFDFTYGDPDPRNRNQRLNVFGMGMLLKTCKENGIKLNVKQLLQEPYNFKNEELIKHVANEQTPKYTKVRKLGNKK